MPPSCLSSFSICIIYTVVNEDFVNGLMDVQFEGSNRANVTIETLVDNIVEGVENFTAQILIPISVSQPMITVLPLADQATVDINDANGMCIVCI